LTGGWQSSGRFTPTATLTAHLAGQPQEKEASLQRLKDEVRFEKVKE
jgi:hypothetical protein